MNNPLFSKATGLSPAKRSRTNCRGSDSRSSFALVVVLAFIVLLSTLVLVFLSKAILLRQLSNSSAVQTQANLFAQGAADSVVADLQQEIADGSVSYVNSSPVYTTDSSTPYSSANFVIYVPKVTDFTVAGVSGHKYATVEPGFQGFTPTLTSFVETDGLNNLLKVSCIKPFYTNTFLSSATVVSGITRGSAALTTTSAQNGRFISLARWNKPLLLTQKSPASTTDFTPVTVFPTPTWIFVSRSGANPTVFSSSLKNSFSLSTSVIGRYAYAVYNEGGLLDATVAGFPTGVSSDFTSRRGRLAQVDLSSIPGIGNAANANALVAWRNRTTAASPTSYTNYVLNATNGFSTVAAGDQTFVSRQALIQYALDHPTQITPQALQYLGTFSKELNAPSYSPPDGGTPARPKTTSVEGYRTAISTDMDDQFNPSLINTRVATTFTRTDGTLAIVGEPLIKNRFPLSRLNWIGHTGPNGATPAQIYDSFGLSYSGGVWSYNHGSSGTRGGGQSILLLSDVASLGREPDFFELLQAGIFVGSLGKSGPTTYSRQTGSDTRTFDSNTTYQILQIGANLVDQYDADSFPTRLAVNDNSGNSVEVDGVEDLPYLERVFKAVYRFHGSGEPANHPRVGFWYVPIIWNPHEDAASYFNSSKYTGPTQFRFVTVGSAFLACTSSDPSVFSPFDPTTSAQSSIVTLPDPPSSTAGVRFTANKNFVQPTALTPTYAPATVSPDLVTDPGTGTSFCGNCLTIFSAPEDSPYHYSFATDWQQPSVTHELQYQDVGGAWVTYTQLKNVQNTYPDWLDSDGTGSTYLPTTFYIRTGTDPRTDRFGSCFENAHQENSVPGFNGTTWSTDTYRPSATSAEYHLYIDTASYPAGNASGWNIGQGYLGWFGMLSENRPLSGFDDLPCATYYTDPDGRLRRADGAYVNDSNANNGTLNNNPLNGGTPLATDQGVVNAATPYGSYNSRPVVLNRPFRSVAEIGYASRGLPWKHLDFFTPETADAALLDIFCLNESPTVVSGKVDLNTRQSAVFQALLTGAIQSDPDSTAISSTDASTLVSRIYSVCLPNTVFTGLNDSLTDSNSNAQLNNFTYCSIAGFLLNKSQLATRWTSRLHYPNLADGSSPNSTIKRRYEAFTRALVDSGNTRTWNLLIDVIAQTGRYKASASSLDQFTVEGERRLWMHVAIDRYTGKVISQYIEPVYE